MAEKVTVMILKVDLQCPCCYKKVKKILCKFPQIRDQVYNEKANTVSITVVCCNPEKLRDKLCCKGSKVIKSIEIVEPPPRKEDRNQEKTKEDRNPTTKKDKEDRNPTTKKDKVRTCCGPCYEGHRGGPCYHGYGVPPCFHGYYGYGHCGCGRPCHVSRCDYYFIEEKPQDCSIM